MIQREEERDNSVRGTIKSILVNEIGKVFVETREDAEMNRYMTKTITIRKPNNLSGKALR